MGHHLTAMYPLPSGWRALCSCGHAARGVHQAAALDAHETHMSAVP